MPLSGDQRALLQLLCERGQSYDDIAGLLGGTPGEVRERARAALTELGGSDPDAEVGLTDYLLGQADPIGRADAVRHLQADPDALELATRIETALRLIAPDAKAPRLPEPRGKRRRAATPAAGDADAAPARTGLRPRRGRPSREKVRRGGRSQTASFAGSRRARLLSNVSSPSPGLHSATTPDPRRRHRRAALPEPNDQDTAPPALTKVRLSATGTPVAAGEVRNSRDSSLVDLGSRLIQGTAPLTLSLADGVARRAIRSIRRLRTTRRRFWARLSVSPTSPAVRAGRLRQGLALADPRSRRRRGAGGPRAGPGRAVHG